MYDLNIQFPQSGYETESSKRFLDKMIEFENLIVEQVINNSIERTRANHYPRTEKLMEHGLHRDQEYHTKTMLLFLNTCDGYTYFKEPDRRVYSVENTAVLFDSFFMHRSTTTTNANRRLTLQVNYAPF